MKCEDCNDRDATVHYTEIENSEKREIHLCEECYREKLQPVHKMVDFTEVLQNLLQGAVRDKTDTATAICPNCGISLAEFRGGGRFGCSHDYHVFEESLAPLLEKIQHDVRHVGKVPTRAGVELKKENELIRLRRELERAVQREDYEQAAALRDQVRGLSGN
jgi:protein arginine kinase activator